MKKFFQSKGKWAAGTVVLLFLIFTVVQLYQSRDVSRAADYIVRDSSGLEVTGAYQMRRLTDTLTIYGTESTDTLTWVSANPDILEVPAGANTESVRIQAKTTGTAAINITVEHQDGSRDQVMIAIEVVFSISEFLNDTTGGSSIVRVNPEDTRRSLVMNYNITLYFGSNALNDTNKLNLTFGDATKAIWTSANEDVLRVNRSNGFVTAVGTGRTTLSVEYNDGVRNYTDSIVVYVRPQLSYEGTPVGSETATENITIETGDSLHVSARFVANPLVSMSSKLIWVVAKSQGADIVLVRDSLGNMGEGGEDVNLIFDQTTCDYRLNAKAGRYTVLFYVDGTYTDFASAQANSPGCAPVSLGVTVNSRYTDKSVTINLGGSYDLADAFNISRSILKDSVSVEILDNPEDCIEWSRGTMTVMGRAIGTARVRVTLNTHVDIPGREVDTVILTINVADTFTMNMTTANIAVGSKITLSGIIGSGTHVEDTEFSWSTTDTDETYITIEPNGRYATVTGKRTTPSNQPVTVTLAWTDTEGVTRIATCTIYVTESAERIGLNHSELQMEVGDTEWLDTGLSGTQNFTWLSSDTSIVTVTADSGNTKAMLTAGTQVGRAVVTVINKDNNAYATCIVTVSAPITELAIEQGESLETYLSAGFIFLNAVYKPDNATATDLIWTSSNQRVATIDEHGVVTLHDVGTTTIQVRPEYNPHGLLATCIITVIEKPITRITPAATTLDLILGDTYTMNVEIEPPDATDPTLLWQSGDESIVVVEGGDITGVGVGTTTVTVSGGDAAPVTIMVTVRNRLESIEFSQSEYDLKMGDTQKLNVIFTPSENVNTNLSWTSSDDSVVTVDKEGNITGVSIGMAMITCVSEDLGITQAITCMINVIEADVLATDFAIDPVNATMYVGSTMQIRAVFTPETTTDQQVSWTSSDTGKATVDETGLVTAKEVGEVSVTAVYSNTPDGEPWLRICNIVIQPAPVPVTGVTVSPTSTQIYVGSSLQLQVTVEPQDAVNKNVTFESSDQAIATVDNAGMVTGVASGGAVIVCRTEDGNYFATCNVTVIQGVSLTLDPAVREIAIGKSFKINKIVAPEGSKKKAEWTSSNEKVARVNASGKVTGVKKGSAKITCRLVNYDVQAVCQVSVKKLNSTIKLNKTRIRIGLGQTYKLKASVWSNNSSLPKVKWKSSNKKIATVGVKGRIRAKRLGYTTITATTKDKIKAKAKCRVQVIRRAKQVKVRPDYAVCYIGMSRKLKATVLPANASIKGVSWKSSDPKVATVVNGRVLGIAVGNATITATARDGSRKSGVCHIQVMEAVPSTSVVVAQSEMTMKRGDSAKLSYSVLPDNTSDAVKFASDNKRVATVSSSGRVRAVGTGSCTITLMMTSGVTSTVAVHVVDLNKSTLNIRQYDTETLTVLGTEETVTWYSSNTRVATVTGGKVVGRGLGSAYIYAYVGGCKLACRVNVTSL